MQAGGDALTFVLRVEGLGLGFTFSSRGKRTDLVSILITPLNLG